MLPLRNRLLTQLPRLFNFRIASQTCRTMSTIPTTQKAIRTHEHGGLDKLTLDTDVPVPSIAETQVLVKNSYNGVNMIEKYFRIGLYKADLPLTHGNEAAGQVVQVGAKVSKFKVGDKVVYTKRGCLQQYNNVDVETENIHKIPAGLDEKQAAAVALQGLTAYAFTTRTHKVTSKDTVLVHAAAGGTGGLIVQLCKHFGARVIGTTSSKEKAEVAKQNGCDYVINYREEDTVKRVMEITNNKGVKVSYDSIGKDTWDISMGAVSNLGHIISFGNASGAVPPVSLLSLSPKSVTITRPVMMSYTKEEPEQLAQELFDLVAKGVIQQNISKEYPLEEFDQAMEELENGKTVGKLVIKID